ncbi:MAG: hypothetical protein K0R26_1537 [Bacteroidota bacterium]|nr:hypothetical protein [Bacteroidota bacterium]
MNPRNIRYLIFAAILSCLIHHNGTAQVDSLVKALSDTVIKKLIVDDIPKKTFKDKFMYPHRWYIKQLRKRRISDFDTSYMMSNKRKLTITIPASKKYYGVNLIDPDSKKKLKISPNNYYNIGFNFSNIYLTFAFVPPLKFGAKPGRGNTKSTDIQITIIGKRVITDINYQNYRGMYVHSNKFLESGENEELIDVRSDIKIISYSVNTMYVFNYRKYSLRGAFSFTDVQRKSSGSFMTGFYHSHVDQTSNDSSFLRYPLTPYFPENLHNITNFSVIGAGFSAGYGYTHVRKKILISAALNLGVGGQKTDFSRNNGTSQNVPINATLHLSAKTAIRYDNLRFFTGALGTYDTNYTPFAVSFHSETYQGKIVLFVGYRFNIKQNGEKILRKMKLIDYNM